MGVTARDVCSETFGTFVTNEFMSAMGGKRPLRSSGDGLQFRFGDQFRRTLLKTLRDLTAANVRSERLELGRLAARIGGRLREPFVQHHRDSAADAGEALSAMIRRVRS